MNKPIAICVTLSAILVFKSSFFEINQYMSVQTVTVMIDYDLIIVT